MRPGETRRHWSEASEELCSLSLGRLRKFAAETGRPAADNMVFVVLKRKIL